MWKMIKKTAWSLIKGLLYACSLYALLLCSLWLCAGAKSEVFSAALAVWALGSVATGYYARRTGLLDAGSLMALIAFGVLGAGLSWLKWQGATLSAAGLFLYWVPSALGWWLSALPFFARKALPKKIG